MGDKKLLIIAATHGNEKIGVEIINELKKRNLNKFFDFLIANPEAERKNVRFLDADLNRSYPGKENSKFYEERKAFKNLEIAKKYKFIIDIHEASEGKDDFIIIPREEISDLFPLQFINLEKILLWPNPKGPISQVLENSIEIEFGAKNRNRKRMILKGVLIMENFINKIKEVDLHESAKEARKEIYYVYGFIPRDNNSELLSELRDFKKTSINGEEKFLPLLSGQYLDQGIICYKMRKIKYRQ